MHLLVVEDDPRLARTLRRLLNDDHHVVEVAGDAATALETAVAGRGSLDGIILDIGLPDRSGLEVVRALRAAGDPVPILILTARDAVDDRVRGLDAGADDYLVKPFAFEELAARLRALGRRGARPVRGPRLTAGPLVLDENDRSVTVDGRPLVLTPREFALLECFLRHPGRLLTRDNLLDAAWPYGIAVTPNTVEAYVHRLREKLGDAGQRIQTERGVGYRLVSP